MTLPCSGGVYLLIWTWMFPISLADALISEHCDSRVQRTCVQCLDISKGKSLITKPWLFWGKCLFSPFWYIETPDSCGTEAIWKCSWCLILYFELIYPAMQLYCCTSRKSHEFAGHSTNGKLIAVPEPPPSLKRLTLRDYELDVGVLNCITCYYRQCTLVHKSTTSVMAGVYLGQPTAVMHFYLLYLFYTVLAYLNSHARGNFRD